MARPISPLTHFILSQPRTAAVSDVIAAAKRAGHVTSAGNIHQVRAKYDLDEEGNVVKKGTSAKKTRKGPKPKVKASGKPKRARRTARPAATPEAPSSGTEIDDAERTLKEATVAVVLAHGTHRAQAVVDDVIATIRALRDA